MRRTGPRQDKFIQPWKKLAQSWHRFTSPGRPMPEEIEIYAKLGMPYLKENAKVLLLGATPELREMLAKYNADVTLVDANLEMILAMTDLMEKKNPQEKWIRADWLKVPLEERYFDLIYGDYVLPNLPFKMHRDFLDRISKWLKPSGYFITRLENLKPEYRLTLSQFIRYFEAKPLNKRTLNEFWEVGVWLVWEPKSGIFSVRRFYQKIKEHLSKYPSGKISRLLKKEPLFPPEKVWYCYLTSDLQRLLKKFFSIERVDYFFGINYPFKDYAPIYKLKPKKT